MLCLVVLGMNGTYAMMLGGAVSQQKLAQKVSWQQGLKLCVTALPYQCAVRYRYSNAVNSEA